MGEYPEAEEHSSDQSAPLRYDAVHSAAQSHCDCDQVCEHDRDREYHQGRPFEEVEVCELVVDVISCWLWCQSERDLNACNNLKQTL